jgi:hypothetical protein
MSGPVRNDGRCAMGAGCDCEHAMDCPDMRPFCENWTPNAAPSDTMTMPRSAYLTAMRSAVEFGVRCAEKGMNLQAALKAWEEL